MQTNSLQIGRVGLFHVPRNPVAGVLPPSYWPQREPEPACAGFLLWHNAIELVLEIGGLRIKQN